MGIPCPWTICQCSHWACDAGWLDLPDGQVKACPDCRPEVARVMADASVDLAVRRRRLRRTPRPSRRDP